MRKKTILSMDFCDVRVAKSMLNSNYNRLLILRAFMFRHFIYCVSHFPASNLRRPTNETTVFVNSSVFLLFLHFRNMSMENTSISVEKVVSQFRFRCGSKIGRKVITLMHTAHGVASLFPKHRYIWSLDYEIPYNWI